MKTKTLVVVSAVKPDFYKYSISVASEFRKSGISCETDLNERNLRKQLDYANSLGIPFVAIVGEREMKARQVTLHDMVSGKEEALSVADAIEKLKGC